MTYLQLQNLIYEITKTNSSSLPVATLNLYTQPGENRVFSVIMQADGRWQYDDGNYTDLPYAIGDLVSGQQDYQIASSQIMVQGIAILTNANLWQRVLPFDAEDLKDHFSPLFDRAQFFSKNGRPLYYDKVGNSIFLYPAPDNGITVTLTSGLKIYFQRQPLLFDYSLGTFTDGTGSTASVPGFNPVYHDLIAYWAAYNYCIANTQIQQANALLAEIQRKELSLTDEYSRRDKDERQRLTMAPIRFR